MYRQQQQQKGYILTSNLGASEAEPKFLPTKLGAAYFLAWFGDFGYYRRSIVIFIENNTFLI